MIPTFEEELEERIRAAWPGSYHLPARGGIVTVPEVRPGGVTARLIELAVEKAAELHHERRFEHNDR